MRARGPSTVAWIATLLTAGGVVTLLSWYYWEKMCSQPARIEVQGMTRAILLYISEYEGQFPPSFEALAGSGLIREESGGDWIALPSEGQGLRGPPGYSFRPKKMIVAWGYRTDSPQGVSRGLLLRHMGLSERDDTVLTCNGSIRQLLREFKAKKARRAETGTVITPVGNRDGYNSR